MVHNDPSSPVRFSNFSEDFRQTNCGVPLRIDRFTEETGDHLLRSASSWLDFEDPHGRLRFCFGLIGIDP